MIRQAKQWFSRLEEHPRYRPLCQFVKFGIVGVSNTLISLAVYQLCLHALHMHYQLANILAFLVSVSNAYYWNSRYVFKSGEHRTLWQHARAYGKAFLSYGATFLLSAALLTLWIEGFGVSESLAPVINLLITIPLNFVLNKFWAFRAKASGMAAQETDSPAETQKGDAT